jgi:hypothetical protein
MPNSTKTRISSSAGRAGRSRKQVKFGSVVVTGVRQDPKVLAHNIKSGQAALKRVAKTLITPGVSIRAGKGVPLYYASEEGPDVLLRDIDGKRERVKLRDGQFIVVDE